VKLAQQEKETVMENFIFWGGNCHDHWHIAASMARTGYVIAVSVHEIVMFGS
jgi:hypothetical protein